MNKLSWLGTVASVLGSFAISFHFFFLGYCLFIVGSVALLTVFGLQRNKSMITLQSFFLVANLIGIYNA